MMNTRYNWHALIQTILINYGFKLYDKYEIVIVIIFNKFTGDIITCEKNLSILIY